MASTPNGGDAHADAQAGRVMLVDRREAARLLGVSPGTIDNLRTRSELPSVKLLGRRLYDVEDLRRLIESRKVLVECRPFERMGPGNG